MWRPFVAKLWGGLNWGLHLLPRRWFRPLADNSVLQKLLRSLAARERTTVTTPEQSILIVNPFFHGELLGAERLKQYEPEMRKFLSTSLDKGMVFYDIGANVGVFSLLAAKQVGETGKVYAFEPEANNFTCLEEAVKLNDFQNIMVERLAVGATSGVGQFDARGGAFSGRLVSQDEQSSRTSDCQVISLNDYLKKDNVRPPSIVKIDVEGGELEVINGMENLLTKNKPVIICELHGSDPNPRSTMQETLLSCGYSLYALTADENFRESPIENLQGGRWFIATPD